MKPGTVVAHIRSGLAYRRQDATSLETVLVVDVEATTASDRPRDAIRDVIQIGGCVLRMESGAVENPCSVLVRPTSSEVTAFCTELTGITAKQARGGLPFVDACDWLKDTFQSDRLVWGSYGDFDRAQFSLQCEREGVRYPFGSPPWTRKG